jgi:hypothetical protein
MNNAPIEVVAKFKLYKKKHTLYATAERRLSVIYTARTNQKEFVVYFSDQRGVG